MKYLKSIVSAFLCLLILFLSGCGKPQGTSSDPSGDGSLAATQPDSLSLFYNSKDSLNPYTITSEHNATLQTLLFDSLVKLDANFKPEYVIAESITLDGKICTITLKNIKFTDGSTLTADDVVYSLKLAKESALNYAKQLSSVKSYTADDSRTVTLTLSKHDPYFINLLTFPILKAESEKRTDENNIVLAPIGSGRYIYDRTAKVLTANENYFLGASPIKNINLVDAPDSEVVNYNLESNNVDVYSSSLNDGRLLSMNGSVSKTTLNNLVYLGVNTNRPILKSVEMRYALSSAIDRTAVTKDAFYSYAAPATGLFHPLWEDAKGIQNFSLTSNSENSVANLEKLGYNSKDNEGFLLNSKGNRISLTLLCNKENQRRMTAANLIKAQIEAIGIEVIVKAFSWDYYVRALQNGEFDLYIAEVSLLNNMNVTELITSNGSLSYGIPNRNSADNAESGKKTADTSSDDSEDSEEPEMLPFENIDKTISKFYKGDASLVDVINAFNAELPIIPICYRSGATVLSSGLQNDNMSSVTDAYYNLTNTTLKIN